MGFNVTRMKQILKSDRNRYSLQRKTGWIPSGLYNKLKKIKVCQNCKKHIKKNEIHHIIPVKYGGLSVESNLQVLCEKCHKLKDKEAGV